MVGLGECGRDVMICLLCVFRWEGYLGKGVIFVFVIFDVVYVKIIVYFFF